MFHDNHDNHVNPTDTGKFNRLLHFVAMALATLFILTLISVCIILGVCLLLGTSHPMDYVFQILPRVGGVVILLCTVGLILSTAQVVWLKWHKPTPTKGDEEDPT